MERETKLGPDRHAICEYCEKEMNLGCSCGMVIVQIGEIDYERIKAGDALDLLSDMEPDEFCRDCNVKAGQYHHPGCDAERCPKCHYQIIGCDCDIRYVKEPEIDMKTNKTA